MRIAHARKENMQQIDEVHGGAGPIRVRRFKYEELNPDQRAFYEAALEAGFQREVQPVRAGAVGRLPPMEVKLNGDTAKTNPSSARYSMRFHMPAEEYGCSPISCVR